MYKAEPVNTVMRNMTFLLVAAVFLLWNLHWHSTQTSRAKAWLIFKWGKTTLIQLHWLG